MYTFSHYQLKESENGYEITLFLGENMVEFSNELGRINKEEKKWIEEEALQYVKNKFSSLNVNTIKIMVGSILVSSILGVSPMGVGTVLAENNQTGIEQQEVLPTFYIVQKGDTLEKLSHQYPTNVQAMIKANNLTTEKLKTGQAITIPFFREMVLNPGQIEGPNNVTMQISQAELEWLAKMIYCESKGESLEGQIAVGAVILNRVKSNEFPNSIEDVVLEKSHGTYQFTPAASGAIYTAVPDVTSMKAAIRAVHGEDPTNGSLYFFNPDLTQDEWIRSRTVSKVIGNHVFAF